MSYDLNLWTVDCVPATAIQKLMPGAKILEIRHQRRNLGRSNPSLSANLPILRYIATQPPIAVGRKHQNGAGTQPWQEG
jgi:hypothetical protein